MAQQKVVAVFVPSVSKAPRTPHGQETLLDTAGFTRGFAIVTPSRYCASYVAHNHPAIWQISQAYTNGTSPIGGICAENVI